ncbi:MAG: hypothetical protein OXU36_01895 [Candidatus Poribacteria bacterium]|nr:hypothetical protein [Candidatus Poribacteria bacterium]
MPNRRETTITNELVNILRNMRHGWELETEVNAFIKGNSELDALVIERGREPIGIEAKFATTTNAKNLIKQAETRLVYELEAEYHTATKTLNNVMAILYPERFKTMPGRDISSQLREADDLQYKLISTLRGTVGHFPENGWAIGTVGDIANALHVGAMPNSQLEQAAKDMEYSIDSAAHLLEDAIVNHRAIGTKIETILHQEVFVGAISESRHLNIQTLRMAALIITDAFVFQSSLAGKAEMESVRSLRQLLPTIDYAHVIADWNTILKVNYRPIFEDARNLVEALATDDRLVKPILTLLCEAAKDLVDTDIAQIHELAGIVFQKLITDRKYVKANYTLPESAVLLSTLVMPELPEGKLPKVADFACGTGALLNGVYQRILSLYEQQGGNGRDIHQKMLEENIAGADVMPNATHLTAASLASTYSGIKIGDTQILTAPYGVMEDGSYAIGSLELLDDVSLLDTDAEQIGGEENTVVKLQQQFQHGDIDIVIQNPPFTRPGSDSNTNIPKSIFQGSDRPKVEQKAMQAMLKSKDRRVAEGISDFAPNFVDLADKKLKRGGTMGFILLLTVLRSPITQKIRDMWATEYHNVVVITIPKRTAKDCAFSADTKKAECIVVATKGIGENTGRGTFVCLKQRPQSTLEAMEIAKQIFASSSTRKLEDVPNGGNIISIGNTNSGQVIDCPIKDGVEWVATRTRSMALLQSAHKLAAGKLHLPMEREPIPIDICRMQDIAKIGSADLYRKDGSFIMVEGWEPNSDGYDALWKVNAPLQRAMVALPNSKAIPRSTENATVKRALDCMSKTHYHINLRFTSNSIISSFTEDPSIGIRSMINVLLNNPRHEIAWTLWCNSTLGIFCHWLHSSKQDMGRGTLRQQTLGTLPTLDIRSLSDKQLAKARMLFERLRYKRMLPVNECAHDLIRHDLDTELLTEVLGINNLGVLTAMQTLREMLCAEPSVQGEKKDKCNLDAELAMLKKKEVALPSWYKDEKLNTSVKNTPI